MVENRETGYSVSPTSTNEVQKSFFNGDGEQGSIYQDDHYCSFTVESKTLHTLTAHLLNKLCKCGHFERK